MTDPTDLNAGPSPGQAAGRRWLLLSLITLACAGFFFAFALAYRIAGGTEKMPNYPPPGPLPPGLFSDPSPEARAFRTTCSQCHDLPSPSLYDAQGWYGVVQKMDRQMAEQGISIPQEQIDLAVKYVITHTRRKPREPSTRPADSPAVSSTNTAE